MDDIVLARFLALDAGTSRIGIAISDPTGLFAQPLDYIRPGNWELLEKLLEEYQPVKVIIGHPLGLSGNKTKQTETVEAFAQDFSRHFPDYPVELFDERMTTKVAESALLEGGMRREKRKVNRDSVAAAILLQNYLDGKNRQKL